MSHVSDGQRAEQATARYLSQKGYEVICRNWRTRWCEIDIVAMKYKTVYFVEVKYRRSISQGSGLDYITKRKLEQMRFAANLWIDDNDWSGDAILCAAEVTGSDFAVSNFVTINS